MATISYEKLKNQPLHSNHQYLCMQASIENGVYEATSFLDKIDAVDISDIPQGECRKALQNAKQTLRRLVGTDQVEIKDFIPDRKSLDRFVRSTFEEIRLRMER